MQFWSINFKESCRPSTNGSLVDYNQKRKEMRLSNVWLRKGKEAKVTFKTFDDDVGTLCYLTKENPQIAMNLEFSEQDIEFRISKTQEQEDEGEEVEVRLAGRSYRSEGLPPFLQGVELKDTKNTLLKVNQKNLNWSKKRFEDETARLEEDSSVEEKDSEDSGVKISKKRKSPPPEPVSEPSVSVERRKKKRVVKRFF